MRRLLFIFCFLLIVLPLSISLPYFPTRDLRVDLIWLLTLYVGFSMSFYRGALLVFILALLQEAVAVGFHGLLVVPFLACYFLLRLGRTHLFFEGGLIQAVWVFFLTLIRKSLEWIMVASLGGKPFLLLPFFLDGLLQALVSMVLFPLLERWLSEEADA